MRKLFLAFIASSTLFLTACSSCLGHTPTPGTAAPQAEAPDDTQSLVATLDSLLKAGDGAQFYAVLANVPEKMMEVTDSTQARQYLKDLSSFLSTHQQEVADLIGKTGDALAAQDLSGLVQFFSDSDQVMTYFHLGGAEGDVVGNVGQTPSGTDNIH